MKRQSSPAWSTFSAVSGNYADLVEYLSALESALPGLRWDALKLTASPAAASTLTLRLYLVEGTR